MNNSTNIDKQLEGLLSTPDYWPDLDDNFLSNQKMS